MSNPRADLHISMSSDPLILTVVPLATLTTYLGRPEPADAGSSYVDLDLMSVSRRHAKITQEGTNYRLENWEGRRGIGLYELTLAPGKTHLIQHGDRFRIPDVDGPHFDITLIVDNMTRFFPIEIEQQRHSVRIRGEKVSFKGQHYRLLLYLYLHAGQLCHYEDIIAHLWPEDEGHELSQRKPALQALLSDIRTEIKTRTGIVGEPNPPSFIRSLPGVGLTLMI